MFILLRCPETECGLGFSTKQCLQVHLRKAHGFSEDNMPTVQRSIPYTFDAYSGGVIKDPGRGKLPDLPPTTPTRLHQHLDPSGQQVLFDTVDVIYHFFFQNFIFRSFFLNICFPFVDPSPNPSIFLFIPEIPRLCLFNPRNRFNLFPEIDN